MKPATFVTLLVALAAGACAPGEPECSTTEPGGNACVPATARAGTPLTLRVRPGGCANTCSGTVEYTCAVTVTGTRVHLAVQQEICTEPESTPSFPPGGQACAEACRIADPLDCNVPALAEGDYTVEAANASDLVLQVRATGDTQCTAPAF